MEILGIGPFEFIVILMIVLIVLGPGDMVKTGRTIGRFLNKIVRSEWWKGIQKVSQEARHLPTILMREANLEDVNRELNDVPSMLGNNLQAKQMPEDFWGWRANPVEKTELQKASQAKPGSAPSQENSNQLPPDG
jgi:Sec-independent protein translocase protein TatA